jgi:hypothetical protein
MAQCAGLLSDWDWRENAGPYKIAGLKYAPREERGRKLFDLGPGGLRNVEHVSRLQHRVFVQLLALQDVLQIQNLYFDPVVGIGTAKQNDLRILGAIRKSTAIATA